MTQPRAWQTRGFLDALRPDPEAEVELALLAAYSADPVSIVAALLAPIARDEEDRPVRRRDLADAVEALREKVRIVVQRGRLAKMRPATRLTGVLDQFVREVGFDERIHSWHPKAALVKVRGQRRVEWRLWIGSRNLTSTENQDLGLLLVGGVRGRGRIIKGVEELARALATRGDLPGASATRLTRELSEVRWRAPAGVKVEQLRISRGDGEWSLPTLPSRVDALTVVSPFLDTRFLRHAGRPSCADGARVLLSTIREVERLAATCTDFGELRALDAPDYPTSEAEGPSATTDAGSAEGEEVGRGLHAKLLHVRTGEQRRVWMGSANATSRAWTGRNVEVVAELAVDQTFEEGLVALLGSARLLDLSARSSLEDTPVEPDRLEAARVEVSAGWAGVIAWDEHGLRLEHVGDPHPAALDMALEAGLVTGDLRPWPRGQSGMDFGAVDQADRTELVQLRLTLEGRSCEWILQAPAKPPFGPDRDRAAFMRLMGAREFLLWIADLLRGAVADIDGPSWLEDTPAAAREPGAAAPASWADGLPTLEEMVAAWAREPAAFDRVRSRVHQYLPALLDQTQASDPAGHGRLAAFQALWATLEAGLGTAS